MTDSSGVEEFEKEQVAVRSEPGGTFLSRCGGGGLPGWKVQLIFWPLVTGGVVLDLWSKSAVFDWLRGQQTNSVSIIDGFLQLVAVENAGAACGIASGRYYLLATVSIIASIAIFVIFLFSGNQKKMFYIALGLFAAGVCGNLYDRVFNEGRVRDFIDVVYWPGKHWPAFNVADSLLCIGVGLVIISSLLTERSCRKHAQQHK